MKTLLCMIALVLALSGCVTATTGKQMVAAGPRPTDQQVEAAVRAYLASSLKDPDSLKQFEMVGTGWQISWYRGLLFGGGHESAWFFCFQYNAKNSYGAYTGVKLDGLAMRVAGDSVTIVPFNAITSDARC